jgi:hypothetical protein
MMGQKECIAPGKVRSNRILDLLGSGLEEGDHRHRTEGNYCLSKHVIGDRHAGGSEGGCKRGMGVNDGAHVLPCPVDGQMEA